MELGFLKPNIPLVEVPYHATTEICTIFPKPGRVLISGPKPVMLKDAGTTHAIVGGEINRQLTFSVRYGTILVRWIGLRGPWVADATITQMAVDTANRATISRGERPQKKAYA